MRKTPSVNRKTPKDGKGSPSGMRKVVRSIRIWLLGGLLLAFLLAAIGMVFPYLYAFLVNSPYLKIETVVMEGADSKLQKDLLQLCGLHTGTSILAVRLKALKKSIERHEWVRSVKIERRFPDQLRISVEKQEPYAMVLSNGLRYFNRWGEVFKLVHEGDSVDFPIVTGLDTADKATPDRLKDVVVVLEALKAESNDWSMAKLSEVHLQGQGGLSLYFKSVKVEVRLSSSETASKMDEFKKIVEHLKAIGRFEEATLIDLNYEDGGVVSFIKG